MMSPKIRVLIISGVLIVASIVSVGVFSARKQSQAKLPKDWLTAIPKVNSKIKNLQIINARIVRQGTEAPGVAFEVLNNSPRGVMAIRISCGNHAISQDGRADEENPTVIIKPYGTLAAEMNGELEPDKPIVITAAVFDDQKAEGEDDSLEILNKVTVREKEIIRARKAQEKKTEGSPKQ